MDDSLTLFQVLLHLNFEDLHEAFEENQITKEDLPSLSLDKIKELIPVNRIEEFLTNRREYFKFPADESLKLMQNNSTVLREINSNGSEIVHRRSNSFIIENINIKEILEGTFEGRHILRLQEINKRLTPSGRRRLVHLIISKILCDCERDLTDKDFKILSTKIVELFPSECSAIYYSPHVLKKDSPTGNSKPVKGKLVNKYFNLRRIPKSIYQSEKVLIENSSTTDITITDEIESSIEWLNNYEEPWEDTEKYWRITYEYRHLKIQNTCNKKISFIYEEWPILKAPKGYTLIELDFKVDKSTINENAIAGFSELFKKIEKVRPLKKDDYFEMLYDLLAAEKIKDDEKTLVELTLLCYMIPSSARIPLGKRKFWKPSCTESLDGIIAHLKNYGDIDKIKIDRQTDAISKNITVQPYVIVVGENDYKVDTVYLCIDSIIYTIPSLLRALDICFKSFHIFNAKYTPQSEHIWLLLQLGLYKLKTKWDKEILSVTEVLNDVEHIALPETLH